MNAFQKQIIIALYEGWNQEYDTVDDFQCHPYSQIELCQLVHREYKPDLEYHHILKTLQNARKNSLVS